MLLLACSAQAQSIDPDLEIKAQAGLLLTAATGQPPPSQPASGSATQQATVTTIVDGQRSVGGVDAQLRSSGALPPGGMLRRSGDGVGIGMSLSGRSNGVPARTDGLFGEYAVELRNRSASDTWRVALKIEYANHVAADGPASAGEGAYAAGLVTLAADGKEHFYSNLTSDTALGDRIDVTPTGGSGQPLDDVGTRTLELELPPGADLHLQGRQELRGAATTPGTGYRGSLAMFFSVVAAVHMQHPAPVADVASVTQVAENNGGTAKLVALVMGLALVLALAWAWLRRHR